MSTEKTVEEAIERSDRQNEIVRIKGNWADVEATLQAKELQFDYVYVGGGCYDVWDDSRDEPGNMGWRLSVGPDYDDYVVTHLEAWSEGSDESIRLTAGLVAWCWDLRHETLTQLTDGDFEAVAAELVYSAKQDRPELNEVNLEAAFMTLLKRKRSEFVSALRESLAE